jgi:hypothetical protein
MCLVITLSLPLFVFFFVASFSLMTVCFRYIQFLLKFNPGRRKKHHTFHLSPFAFCLLDVRRLAVRLFACSLFRLSVQVLLPHDHQGDTVDATYGGREGTGTNIVQS